MAKPQIRSMALTIKERDFIHTARFSGESTLQIVVTEILPFALSWSLSNFMNATLSAIGSESSLVRSGSCHRETWFLLVT